MARSVWKGPFVDGYLLKKAEKSRGIGPQRGDQDLVAPLDDPAAVRRPDLRRLQRPEVHPGARSPRTWSATSSASSRRPAPSRPRAATRRRRGLTMSKPTAPAPRGGQRGQGGAAHAARQPAQAQPGRRHDPRQEGRRRRVNELDLLASKRIAQDVKKALQVGDRQRREQPQSRRRPAGRRRGRRSARAS